MSWESFYFVCFLIGFFFSLLAFLAGFGFLHVPGLHFHASHGSRGGQNRPSISEPSRLFSRGSAARAICSRAIRTSGRCWPSASRLLSGLGGAAVVFWFLVNAAGATKRSSIPADYEMTGVLGKSAAPCTRAVPAK